MNEFKLINNYFKKLTKKSPSSLNLNDDVFFDKKKQLVISVDTYVEGIHFINFKKPDLVIKKIVRSSISDLICKGVKPKYYFISGSGDKKKFSKSNLTKMIKSLKEEQNKYNLFIKWWRYSFFKKLKFYNYIRWLFKKIIYRNRAKIRR